MSDRAALIADESKLGAYHVKFVGHRRDFVEQIIKVRAGHNPRPYDLGAIKLDGMQALLRGAFAGSPTPLKDIPTKDGESRSLKHKVVRKSETKNEKTKPGK